jgi:DNA-3-methyladenine glycosylase
MPPLAPLARAFFVRDSVAVARDLLGRWLVREQGGERLVLRLVEVEAYLGPGDRAAHTWGGRRTERVRSMYLGGGHAYVYRIYGIHHCLNVVTGRPGDGTAVLLRAGEVVEGGEAMRRRRGLGPTPRPGELAGGPGKLCRALAVDRALDGVSLLAGELRIAAGEPVDDAAVVRGPRVGVGYAGEAAGWPLRLALAASAEVSRPRPRQPFTPSSGGSGSAPSATASRTAAERRAPASDRA